MLNYHPESDSYFESEEYDVGDGCVEDVTGLPEYEAEFKRRQQ